MEELILELIVNVMKKEVSNKISLNLKENDLGVVIKNKKIKISVNKI